MTAAPARPDDVFLTTEEAAAFVRLSPRTLERFRVEGSGPPFCKAGPGKRARVLYRKADLEAWLAGFSFRSTSEYDRER
ncbi:MAG: helix-turn-helix domain-containing protein [Hyphomicrobiaceae bacterium]|nr:helix-turn-helix domain-containing protein [Hyphomicrobiaceae bacterium]